MVTPTTRRQYTNDERACAVAAVAANAGSVHGTARILRIPETSLRQWCNGERHPELLPLSERYKRDLAERFEGLVWRLLEIVEDKMDTLSAAEAVVAMGICVDKWLLLTGQATEITAVRDESHLDAFRERYGRLKESTDSPCPARAGGGV